MQFKKMAEVDLKLYLLSGSQIDIDSLVIEPYKLREIKDYGYSNYMQNLQWITLSIDDFINSVDDENKKKVLDEQKDNLKAFDFYIKLGGKDFVDAIIKSLKMVLKTDDVRVLEDGVIAVDFVKQGIFILDDKGGFTVDEAVLDSLTEDEIKLVHRDNFDSIVEVIKLQNYLTKPSENKKNNEENPADEETRKLMEHMKKMREKVEAKKRKQKQQEKGDTEIDISDIISAVSSKSNSINKLNVWDLTLYQLYDEYSRLELIDNYDFSIKAVLAGAEKVDLKHWSSKL